MPFTKRLVILTIAFSGFVIGIFWFINSQSTAGGYSAWSEWSVCTRTCGEGLQGKIRKCNTPTPGPFGKRCMGANVITRKCKEAHCPIHGGLSEWSEYGNCDKSCGRGTRKRVRTCTNPSPLFGGRDCVGALEQTEACNTQPCPVNGGFSDWSEFSKCTLDSGTCGNGKKVRMRTCTKPAPAFGGRPCDGPVAETHFCTVPCPTTQQTTTQLINTTTAVATNTTAVPTVQNAEKETTTVA